MLIKTFKKGAAFSAKLPSSKSITNRALLLASLCDGTVAVRNILRSRDTVIMLDCLKKLGFEISENKNDVLIKGLGGEIPNNSAKLFVGNAGTAARFITALCALSANGEYEFDSDAEMYNRPMKGLLLALENSGAKFEFLGEKYAFPFKMKSRGLGGGKTLIDATASSQILSAFLMVSARANGDSVVELNGDTVSKPFVAMTLKMMEQFGFCAQFCKSGYFVKKQIVQTNICEYEVEPDATAASYPITMAAVNKGAVLVKNFAKCVLQGDAEYSDILAKIGLIKTSNVDGDLLVENLHNFDCNTDLDFNAISDTFLSLAAISPLLNKKIKITGIAHTRKQETDRVLAMATELKKLCKSVAIDNDSIEITPSLPEELKQTAQKPVLIKTYNDHRMAMAFAVLGSCNLNGREWIDIENPQCCGKTWPEFFEDMENWKMQSDKFKVVAIDGGAAVGKSSVSKESSKTLNYMHVDTGSHYRTLTYILLENNLSYDSADSDIINTLNRLEISTKIEGTNQAKMAVNGTIVKDSDIRTERINANVAYFAAKPFLREFLKNYQRSMKDEAKKLGFNGLIMEGRDIGSVIFPDADVRIFLDANPETRAARRAKEGIGDSVAKRDALDSKRKTAPLVCSEGAIKIDTSYMTKDEVIQKSISIILQA